MTDVPPLPPLGKPPTPALSTVDYVVKTTHEALTLIAAGEGERALVMLLHALKEAQDEIVRLNRRVRKLEADR